MTSDLHDTESGEDADPRPGHGAEAFVQAVVSQLARGVEDAGAGAQQQVDWLADRLTSILLACESSNTEFAVETLTEDPLLLSAVFQNIDLLYAHDYPYADAVSMLTLDAVHRAVEAAEG